MFYAAIGEYERLPILQARTTMVRIGLDVTTVANTFTQAAWTSTSPRIISQTILFALDSGPEPQFYKACLMFIALHIATLCGTFAEPLIPATLSGCKKGPACCFQE